MLAILIVLGFVCAIGSLLLFAHLASYPEPRGPKPKGLTMFFLGMAALTFFTAALLVSAIGSSSQKPAFQDGSPNRVEPFSFGGEISRLGFCGKTRTWHGGNLGKASRHISA